MVKIPERFEHAHPDNLAEDVRMAIRAWGEQQKTGKESIMFFGGTGVGKTYAMYSMLVNRPNLIYKFYNSADLIEEIRQSFKYKSVRNPLEYLKGYSGFLFIDDFGAEKLSDFVQESFYQIINDRYINKLPTVISTNFELGEIAERLGERVASRIAEMCYLIKITGRDRRLS